MTSTTTSLSSGTNPSTYGSSATLTATVTPQTVGAGMTGTVSFYDGAVRLGSASLIWGSSTGHAAVSVASLLGGSHALTAACSGDANCTQSTSAVWGRRCR